MTSKLTTEHYVTLFDQAYLPQGMCLHESLKAQAQPFHLWILCMDQEVEESLKKLQLEHVSLIPLKDAETEALCQVKPTRTRGEYCWTMTPFTPQLVFDRAPEVKRATYIDADIFFFSSPRPIFKELETARKSVLITEHAYAPEYDQTATSGRFCVQFMTFNNDEGGHKVMKWWQDRCLEWCYARIEDGKFGDQKYLDDWPDRFAAEVHVLDNKSLALGPWNAGYRFSEDLVFYHFHGLKLISDRRLQLYSHYNVGEAIRLYELYRSQFQKQLDNIRQLNLEIRSTPAGGSLLQRVKAKLRETVGKTAVVSV